MEGRDEVLHTSFDRSIISVLWELIRNFRKPCRSFRELASSEFGRQLAKGSEA
jgi:hypothetical protein